MTEVTPNVSVTPRDVREPDSSPTGRQGDAEHGDLTAFARMLGRAGSEQVASDPSTGPAETGSETPVLPGAGPMGGHGGPLPVTPVNSAAYLPPDQVSALLGKASGIPVSETGPDGAHDAAAKTSPIPISEPSGLSRDSGLALDTGPADIRVTGENDEARLPRRADAFENSGVFGRGLIGAPAGDAAVSPLSGHDPAASRLRDPEAVRADARLLDTERQELRDAHRPAARASTAPLLSENGRARAAGPVVAGRVAASADMIRVLSNLGLAPEPGNFAAAEGAAEAEPALRQADVQRLNLALGRQHAQAVQLSFQFTPAGLKLIARVGDLSADEQDKLRQDIRAMLDRHGVSASSIEILTQLPGTGDQSGGER